MIPAVARAMMAVTARCLGEDRREWAAAMRAELGVASAGGRPLAFAAGCLGAALRDMPRRAEGRFALSNYALALGVMLPVAAFQLGCALFGQPYLHPAQDGLSRAALAGMREIHLRAIPALSLTLLALAAAQLCIAWLLLEHDWARVTRLGMAAMAGAVTLVIVLGVLFLDIGQAMMQAIILSIEFVAILRMAEWHGRLAPAPAGEPPG